MAAAQSSRRVRMKLTRWLRMRRWLKASAAITVETTEMGSRMIRIVNMSSEKGKNFKNHLFPSKRR